MSSSGFKNQNLVNIDSIQLINQASTPEILEDSEIVLYSADGRIFRSSASDGLLQIDVPPQLTFRFYNNSSDTDGYLRFIPGSSCNLLPLVIHQDMILHAVTIVSEAPITGDITILKNDQELTVIGLDNQSSKVTSGLLQECVAGDIIKLSTDIASSTKLGVVLIFKILFE